MNGELIVSPAHGLCNRFLPIISGYILAEKYNKKFTILWSIRRDCNAAFTDLFEVPREITVIDNKQLKKNDKHPYLEGKSVVFFDLMGDFPWNKVEENNILVQRTPGHHFFLSSIAYELISGKENFMKKVSEVLKKFVPIKEILDKRVLLPANTIGIHIRRGDTVQWARQGIESDKKKLFFSSDERFITNINNLLKKDSTLKFFLATDGKDTKKLFKEKYKDRIITYNHQNIRRGSKVGIQSAVLDLITLADTQMIIGSYKSTFSVIASWMSMIPIQGVHSDPPTSWQNSFLTKVIDEYKGVKLV